MRRRQPKQDFTDLEESDATYHQSTIGDVAFNGRHLQINANYGCFMMMNTANPAAASIPDNIRVNPTPSMHPSRIKVDITLPRQAWSTCYKVERGSSAVECRTRNQVSPGSNPPLLPFRRFDIFVLSIVAPVDSSV